MSDTKIIVNRSKATRRVTKNKHVLNMGANEFPPDVEAEILADPYFIACARRGIFKVESAPVVAAEVTIDPDDHVVNLRALHVVEALKAVKACTSVAQLETWLDQDGRKTVRDAILKRGIQLTDKKPTADADDAPDATAGTTEAGYPIVGG
jgi:hypothetical protein